MADENVNEQIASQQAALQAAQQAAQAAQQAAQAAAGFAGQTIYPQRPRPKFEFDLTLEGHFYPDSRRYDFEELADGELYQSSDVLDVVTKVQLRADNTKNPEGRAATGEPYISFVGRYCKGGTISVNAFGNDEKIFKELLHNPEVWYLNIIGKQMIGGQLRGTSIKYGDANFAKKLGGNLSIRVAELIVVYKPKPGEAPREEKVITLPNCTSSVLPRVRMNLSQF